MNVTERVRRNIIKLRKQKDYTQERLAYESDISKGYLSEIEAGKKSPTIRTLEKLADTLEISLIKFVE